MVSDVRKAVAEYWKDSVAGPQVLAGSRILLYIIISDTFRYIKLKWCRRNGLTKGKIGTIAIKENERLSRALAWCGFHMVTGQKLEKLGLVYPAGQEREAEGR